MEKIFVEDQWQIYMYLLRCAIWNNEPEIEIMEKYAHVSAMELLEKARGSAQYLLLEKYIRKFADYRKERIPSSYNGELTVIIRVYEKYKNIRQVLEKAKECGVQLIVFKGCVLANLYPEYVRRYSCDTDLFVYREQKEQALDLLLELGYLINEQHSNAEVTVLVREQTQHVIELHICLWEDYEGKRLDHSKFQFNSTRKLGHDSSMWF